MQANSENMRRMLAALKALTAYASHQGRRGAPMRGDPDDMQPMITDLLTDLRHYCTANGVDFDKHLRRSAEHFNAEIAP